ncbi:MAG TPA: hypothetical protein VH879_11505 [Gemmatimonadales bacterium]|jgi:ABC-type nickel/cobalt efflux system permease component RcnA
MPGLDQWIARLGDGSAVMAMVVALLLGLRHATDPDHLTAVSTLVLSDSRRGAERAARLGIAWGLGHATTLFTFGLPIVLFRSYLPPAVLRAAEFAIGLVIVGLAARLLFRWRRGYQHVHPHSHGGLRHAHPHGHEHGHESYHPEEHSHPHGEEALGRSPVAAYTIGLVHGLGGSAAVGLLLVGAISGKVQGVLALLLFAGGTALSMALASAAFGYTLASGRNTRTVAAVVPAFGVVSLLFGAWYAIAALGGA